MGLGKQPKTLKRWARTMPFAGRITALLGAALLVVPAPGLANSGEDTCRPEPATPCLETPSAYQEAWEQYAVACVAPHLYSTIPWSYDPVAGDARLYPQEFAYAWAGGSRNLETFLEIRCRYRDAPAKARVGIESYVGFPVPIRNREPGAASTPLPMFVYTLSAVEPQEEGRDVTVTVPTFSAWVQILTQEFSLAFGTAAQRELVARYADLRTTGRQALRKQRDPVWAFREITGCKRSREWQGAPGFPPLDSLAGCSEAYRRARIAAGGAKVQPGGPTTRACFERFAADSGAPRDAVALRALLELCQDASALNTGMGLGYNAMPNPLVCKRWARQSVAEKFTGPEFILPNGTLRPAGLGESWAVVNLEALEDARYDLRGGYCR